MRSDAHDPDRAIGIRMASPPIRRLSPEPRRWQDDCTEIVTIAIALAVLVGLILPHLLGGR